VTTSILHYKKSQVWNIISSVCPACTLNFWTNNQFHKTCMNLKPLLSWNVLIHYHQQYQN